MTMCSIGLPQWWNHTHRSWQAYPPSSLLSSYPLAFLWDLAWHLFWSRALKRSGPRLGFWNWNFHFLPRTKMLFFSPHGLLTNPWNANPNQAFSSLPHPKLFPCVQAISLWSEQCYHRSACKTSQVARFTHWASFYLLMVALTPEVSLFVWSNLLSGRNSLRLKGPVENYTNKC